MISSCRTRDWLGCAFAVVVITVMATGVSAQTPASKSHPTKSSSKSKHASSQASTRTAPAHAAPAHAASAHAAPAPAAARVATATQSATITAAPAAGTIGGTPGAGALASNAPLALRDAPDGKVLATIGTATPITPLTRDRGWVRVRVDGWVKDDGLAPASATVGALSAADLRADPQAARGTVVRWDVQVLALAHADVLHRDLTLAEPYLLVRGPGSENALLYIAIPPALVPAATALTAVAPVTATIVATVRNGRSAPLGVPILDAQSLTRR